MKQFRLASEKKDKSMFTLKEINDSGFLDIVGLVCPYIPSVCHICGKEIKLKLTEDVMRLPCDCGYVRTTKSRIAGVETPYTVYKMEPRAYNGMLALGNPFGYGMLALENPVWMRIPRMVVGFAEDTDKHKSTMMVLPETMLSMLKAQSLWRDYSQSQVEAEDARYILEAAEENAAKALHDLCKALTLTPKEE